MQVNFINTNYKSDNPISLAIGNFDGLHLGHDYLLKLLKKNVNPTVLTFEPHPKAFFDKKNYNNRLTPLRAKLELLEPYGLKQCLIMRFDKSLANKTADQFISFLINNLNAKNIITGKDFCFGTNRLGNADLLYEKSSELKFSYLAANKIKLDGFDISSSAIRRALKNADILLANKMLGYNYFIYGKVAHGSKQGRTINMPTANIYLHNNLEIKFGVYAVKATLADKTYNAVMNFGTKPTVNGKKPCYEVHIFDFDDNIYGQQIKVELVKFIRPEKKFLNLDELKLQILQDIVKAKNIL